MASFLKFSPIWLVPCVAGDETMYKDIKVSDAWA